MPPRYQSPLLIAPDVIGGTPVLLIAARTHVATLDIHALIQHIQRVVVSCIRQVANTKIVMIVRGNPSQRVIQGHGKIQCKKEAAGLM